MMNDHLFSVNEVVNLSKTMPHQLIRNCKLDSDQKFVWLTNDTQLQIFLLSDGTKVLEYDFSSYAKSMAIADVIQYKISLVKSILIIALSSESNKSLLLLFDIQKSKIIRSFRIRNNITKICKIDEWLDKEIYPFQPYMNEVIIFGTEQGLIYIMDLHLTFVYSSYEFVNEDQDRSLEFLTKTEVKNGMPLKSTHYAVIINEECIVDSNFLFWNNDNTEEIKIDAQKIAVSALEYCERIRGLFVGFNIGFWQIWSLEMLSILYTSYMSSVVCPVSHFAFMEPVDDPKQFCYLWIVYSDNELLQTSSVPKAMLFSLLFEEKIQEDDGRYRYEKILTCSYRFNMELDGIRKGVSAAICLSTDTLSKIVDDEQIKLCSFVWRTANEKFDEFDTHCCLFDLNQWYKDEMPNSINYKNLLKYNNSVNFMWYFNISSTIKKLTNKIDKLAISDISINEKSVVGFTQPLGPCEEFYYPSALYFEFNVLSNRNVYKMVHRGVQNAVLHEIETLNSHFLWDPQEVFNKCQKVALITFHFDNIDLDNITIETQRDSIMALALSHNMINWLLKCAKNWALGAHFNFGCTLDRFLQWAYNCSLFLRKNACDNAKLLIVGTINYNDLVASTKRIVYFRVQLYNLSVIYKQMSKNLENTIEKNICTHLLQQTEALEAICTYFKVIEWCSFHGILPERLVPYENFVREHLIGRQKNRSKTLFIEQFIKNEFDKECMKDDWFTYSEDECYPPKNFQAMLQIYLKPMRNLLNKHIVFYYFLIDLFHHFQESATNDYSSLLQSFTTHFCIGKSFESMILGFWHLDQGHHQDAFAEFSQPWVRLNELEICYHRFVINKFIDNQERLLALNYFKNVNIVFEDNEDHYVIITLLVSEQFARDAYMYVSKQRTDQNTEALLIHFFKECKKYGKIDELLQISFNKFEESVLLKYCMVCDHKEIYLPYFIQHNRLLEVLELKNKIVEDKSIFYGSQKSIPASLIMIEDYSKNLPIPMHSLLNAYSEHENDFRNQINAPMVPLSRIMNSDLIHKEYKSSFQYALLVEAKKIDRKNNFVPFLSNTFSDPSDTKSKTLSATPQNTIAPKKTPLDRILFNGHKSYPISELLKVPYFIAENEYALSSQQQSSQGIVKKVTDFEIGSKKLRFQIPQRGRSESYNSDNTSVIAKQILESSGSSNDSRMVTVIDDLSHDDERSQFSVTKLNMPVIYTDEPIVTQIQTPHKSRSTSISSLNEQEIVPLTELNKSKSKSSGKSLSKSPSKSGTSNSDMDVECKASDKMSTKSRVKNIGRRSRLTNSDMEIENKTITSGKRSRASSVSSVHSKRSSSSDSNSDHGSEHINERKRFRSDSFDSNRLKVKSTRKSSENQVDDVTNKNDQSPEVILRTRILRQRSRTPSAKSDYSNVEELSNKSNNQTSAESVHDHLENSNMQIDDSLSGVKFDESSVMSPKPDDDKYVNEVAGHSRTRSTRSSSRLKEKYLHDEKRKEIERWAIDSSQQEEYELNNKRQLRSRSLQLVSDADEGDRDKLHDRCQSLEPSGSTRKTVNVLRKRRNSTGTNSSRKAAKVVKKNAMLQTIDEDSEITEIVPVTRRKTRSMSSMSINSVASSSVRLSAIYEDQEGSSSAKSSLMDEAFKREKPPPKSGRSRTPTSSTIYWDDSVDIYTNEKSNDSCSTSIITESSINGNEVNDINENDDNVSVISVSSSKISKATATSLGSRRSTRSSSLRAQKVLKSMK